VTWHEDIETGATLGRPAFERLQRGIFSGEVEMLLVWKLDRISRNMRDDINQLADGNF
jgi:DNA invertase Pin-like site-specific DNA recombinase